MPRNLRSALLGGLLVGTAALAPAQSSSDIIYNLLRQMKPTVLAAWHGGDREQNPIQSFSAKPSTITAGQTTAVVAPSHTTTYTLTATTAWGKSVSKEVTVNVAADPSIANAVIDPMQPGNCVASGYIGFSHEWGQAQLLMGDPANWNQSDLPPTPGQFNRIRWRTDINPRRRE